MAFLLRRDLLAAFAILLLAGCGGNREGQGGGTVRIDGSSTVYPISEAIGEEFMKSGANIAVTAASSGTGGGIQKLIRQEIDIADASRPIKPSEAEEARAAKVEYIELPVAYDGLAVLVNRQNTWLDCITVDEMKKIWSPDSKVNNWSQVRAGFPDRPLTLFGPGTDSGTYDYFTEAIVGEEGSSRSDFTPSEDDNVLVRGIEGDQNALGFFGLAYYENNQERLKLVKVDDGNGSNGAGCVAPSSATVTDGTYQPLSRPLFIYVRKAAAGDPAVKQFVEYYLNNVASIAPSVGYVPLSGQAYQLALQRFAQGITGSVFEGGGSQVGVRLEDLLKAEGGTAPADSTPGSIPDSTR